MKQKNRYIRENVLDQTGLHNIDLELNYDDYKVHMDWTVSEDKQNYMSLVENFLENCIFCDYRIVQTGKNSYTVYVEDYLREKQADRLFNILLKIFELIDAAEYYSLMTGSRYAPPLYIENDEQLKSICYCLVNGNTLDLRKVKLSDRIKKLQLNNIIKSKNNIEYIDITGFDTSNLTYISFEWFKYLKEIYGISDIDISNIKYMNDIFYECSSLEELDVSKWDVSKVNDIGYMFNNCSSLKKLDVSNWDVSSVKYMECVFNGCSSLEELDVSGWDVSSVKYMECMFTGCKSLKTLELSKWNISKVKYMTDMFKDTNITFIGRKPSWVK